MTVERNESDTQQRPKSAPRPSRRPKKQTKSMGMPDTTAAPACAEVEVEGTGEDQVGDEDAAAEGSGPPEEDAEVLAEVPAEVDQQGAKDRRTVSGEKDEDEPDGRVRSALEIARLTLSVNFHRLNLIKVHAMELLPWEKELRKQRVPGVTGRLGGMCMRFLCWRRAVLQAAACFWCGASVLRIIAFSKALAATDGGSEDGVVFGVRMGEYAPYFADHILKEQVAAAITILSNLVAVGFAFLAAYFWLRQSKSRPLAMASYMLGYMTPFFLHMYISYRNAVDITGIQRHMCRDVLSGKFKDERWAPRLLVQRFGGEKMLGVSRKMLDAFLDPGIPGVESLGVYVDPMICESDPEGWRDIIEQLLEEHGRLQKSADEPCPAAFQGRARQLWESFGLDPSKAQNITSEPAAAAAAAALQGTSAGSAVDDAAAINEICSSAPCTSCIGNSSCLQLYPAQLALEAGRSTRLLLRHLGSDLGEECAPCWQPMGFALGAGDMEADTWSCYSLCVPLQAAEGGASSVAVEGALAGMNELKNVTEEAKLAQVLVRALDTCVQLEEVHIIQLLVRSAAAEEPWQLLLGLRAALKAVAVLLPTAFALMSGTLRGAMVAKLVIPYSRIPAMILACAIGYSLPHFLLLLILLKSLIGDALLLPAISAFVLSLVVFLPWQRLYGKPIMGSEDLTSPQAHEEAEVAIDLRMRIQLCLNIAFVVFLLLWFSQWADFLVSLASSGLVDLDVSSVRGVLFSASFWRNLSFTSVTLVCNVFGVAKIAGVCFADGLLYTVMLVDEANVDADAQSAAFLPKSRTSLGSLGSRASSAKRNDRMVVALFAELHKGLLGREPVTARHARCPKCMQAEDAKSIDNEVTFKLKKKAPIWRARARQAAASIRNLAGAPKMDME